MEVVSMNFTGDKNNRIGNPTRNSGTNRTLSRNQSDNLLPASFFSGGSYIGGGLLSTPPSSVSQSFSPAVSVFRPPQILWKNRQQPPLLPLPISMSPNHLNINISRSSSTSNNNIRLSPPRNTKNIKNRVRDHSLTPKKSKNQKKNSKKEVRDLLPPATADEKKAPPAESSINQLITPDPKDLPKEVVISRVFCSSINKSCDIVSVDFDKFSGSAMFTPSPPPSSLPLPTFFLRSKLSCKVEASGVDVGATDGLRRLLRL